MKSWARSKTVLVNLIILAVGVVGVVAASDLVQENPRATLALTTIVLPVLNVFLRWLTDQPITSVSKSLDALRPRINRNSAANRYRV